MRDTRDSTPGWMGALVSVSLVVASAQARAAAADDEAAFRDLYRELVEINTTLSEGSCTAAAEAMANRLRAAGLAATDVQVLAPPDRPKQGNLVAILPGRDRELQPLLLLAHIDVVEAKRADWTRDPFKLVEEGGFFYARGASDDKAMAAVFTDTLIRFRSEDYRPRRDIKLALTCGEETPDEFNGVKWLMETRPELLKAGFALNEGAGGLLDVAGNPLSLEVQAGEKVYQDFMLQTTNPGGHSSRPRKDNAINELVAGLARLAAYQFPISLNPTTTAYFEEQAKLQPPEVAADMRALLANPVEGEAVDRLWTVNPGWNSMLRTTCVTTQIDGGHAPNALPQRARANVNCRILPGVPVETVLQQLTKVVADDRIAISTEGDPGITAPVPPLTPELMAAVRTVAGRVWPGVAIVPTMATGATDGRFLNAGGIPTYGMSGMFHDAEGSRAHGLDEHIRVKSLFDGRRFLYEIVRIYAESRD